MHVYVVEGSEDGILEVQGAMTRAYKTALRYVEDALALEEEDLTPEVVGFVGPWAEKTWLRQEANLSDARQIVKCSDSVDVIDPRPGSRRVRATITWYQVR